MHQAEDTVGHEALVEQRLQSCWRGDALGSLRQGPLLGEEALAIARQLADAFDAWRRRVNPPVGEATHCTTAAG